MTSMTKIVRKKLTRETKHWILISIFIFGAILVIDQLWLFGLPTQPILPDLSDLDPTSSPVIHHWMLGLPLAIISIIIMRRRKML